MGVFGHGSLAVEPGKNYLDTVYGLVRPLLFSFDAETAHGIVMGGAAFVARSPMLCSLVAKRAPKAPESLAVSLFGKTFPHPLGLAAGLDKNGEAIDFWAALGFAFVEVGTVTPGEGQPGNDKPRLYRAKPDVSLVNRMGFNNHGAPGLAARLKVRRSQVIVGANLGKAKVTPNDEATEDYLKGLHAVHALSDYIVINVSSPNTPGLRDLQAVDSLRPLVERVKAEERVLAGEGVSRPIFVKIAPDLADEDVEAAADMALETKVDGLIATNTTLRHDLLSAPPVIAGGVSGAVLTPRALECTRRLYKRLNGKLPIIGVGGIMNADDAWARIGAGATLLQVYTGLVYHGPALIREIVDGLATRLAAAGLSRIDEAVGRDV